MVKKQETHGLGWIPDRPDNRDHLYSVKSYEPIAQTYLSIVDLTSEMPPVYDQGSIGSCTGNAIGAAFWFLLAEQKLKKFTPSRLFIYYNEREMENSVAYDSGAMIRDGIKSVATIGVCDEIVWPYSKNLRTKPDVKSYRNAKRRHHQTLEYQRVDRDLNQFRHALTNRNPVVIGFSVYQNFYDSGRAPFFTAFPQGSQVGGHAVLVVGYDDTRNCFICRNSWGEGWGNKGYFYLPYEFITNPGLSDDFWVLLKAS